MKRLNVCGRWRMTWVILVGYTLWRTVNRLICGSVRLNKRMVIIYSPLLGEMALQIYPTKCIDEHRLNCWTKRLYKTVMTDVYDQNLQKLVQSGYAERAPENKLNRMMLQCGIQHTILCWNLVMWDQFFIVRRDTREWVLMVNGLNRAYKLAHVLLRFRQFK